MGGALIGARLTKQVSTALEIPMNDATFWVDSMNVLHWIHGRSRDYKPFVAIRVREIHDKSCPDQWKYVPTELNPADYGSRGMNVSEMKDSQQWWFGPEFLTKSKDSWPEEKIEREPNAETYKEMKVDARKEESVSTKDQCLSFTTTNQEERQLWRLNPSRYSKWYSVNDDNKIEFGLSLVRARCWVHMFIDNCRRAREERTRGELTEDELRRTEEKIIQEAQYEIACSQPEILWEN